MNSLEKIIVALCAEIEGYIKARTGPGYVPTHWLATIESEPSVEQSSTLYGMISSFGGAVAAFLPSMPLPRSAFSVADLKVDNARKLMTTLQSLYLRAANAYKFEDIKDILNDLSQKISEQIAAEKQLFGFFVGPGEYDKKLDYIRSVINYLTTDSDLKLLSSVNSCEANREKLIIENTDEHKYLPTDVVSYLYSQHFAIISNMHKNEACTDYKWPIELIEIELRNLMNFFDDKTRPNNIRVLNNIQKSLNNLKEATSACEDVFTVQFNKQIHSYNTAVAELLNKKQSYAQILHKIQ